MIFIGVQIGHPQLNATAITTTSVYVRDQLKVLMAVLALVGLSSVDWTDAGEVSRSIRAFERLLLDVRPDGVYGASNAWDAFVRAMERDGYEVTDAGHISATAGTPWLPADELGKLRDPAAIADQLTRIRTGLGPIRLSPSGVRRS